MKQTFSFWCVTNRGVEDAALLAGAKKIGFQGVELLGEPLWQTARDNGLEITAINLLKGGLSPGFNRAARWPIIEAQANETIAKAQKWGIKGLICLSGDADGLDDVRGTEGCIENFLKLAPLAESAGVTLLLEPLNSKVDHVGHQCDRWEFAYNICRQVNSPAVKILFDIYHMQLMGGDLINAIRKAHQWIGHYHTAGAPGRNEPDETQEIHYPAIYRAIAETGFQGYIGHEFIPKRFGPLEALERAFQACASA